MGIKNFNDFDKMNEGQDKEESIVEMVGDWIENERADGATESEVRAEIDNYIERPFTNCRYILATN